MSKVSRPTPTHNPLMLKRSETLAISQSPISTIKMEEEEDDSSHLIIIERVNVDNEVQIKLSPDAKVEPCILRRADTSTIFHCESCDYSSHNKHYLKQHLQLVHNSIRPFKCPFCDYAGKRSHALKEHLIVHSQERPYECEHCNATFRKKSHLTNHVKLHNVQKSITCKLCNAMLGDESKFEKHLSFKHNTDKIFSCEACDFVAAQKSEIIAHLQTHRKDSPFKCNLCSFTTPDLGALSSHANIHIASEKTEPMALSDMQGKEMILKCTECGFSAKHSSVMKHHMYNHMAPNKTTVVGCQKIPVHAAPQASLVNGSIMGPFPENATFKCTDCSFVNKDATVLVKHLLAHKVKKQSIVKSEEPDVDSECPVQDQLSTSVPVKVFSVPTLESQKTSVKGPMLPFVHNQATGYFCCTLCGYTCEFQRTIKAHIWKHTGNKNVNYPMFQNGPLSIYDEHTPITLDLGSGKTLPQLMSIPQQQKNNEGVLFTQNASCKGLTNDQSACESIENGMISYPVVSDMLNSPAVDSGVKIVKPEPRKNSSGVANMISIPVIGVVDESRLQKVDNESLKAAVNISQPSIVKSAVVKGANSESTDFIASSALPGEPSKCQISLQQVNHMDTLSNMSDDEMATDANVVVETVNTASPASSLTSIANQEHSPENRKVGSINTTDQRNDCNRLQMQQIWNTSDNESAVALLSLLVEDRPASSSSSPGPQQIVEEVVVEKEVRSDSDNEQGGDRMSVLKPKSGICSSLLAVIEQLRERSKSESEGDSISKLSKDYLVEDDVSAEGMKNIEQLADEHGEVKYRCMLCHYSNPRALLIRLHMRLHKSKQPFECSLCSFIAKSSESLQDHMIKHCKVRTYQCKLCPSAFNYKSQLRAHMRAHSEKDPFCCESCDFETMDAMTYRTHVRYHIDKSFFRCDFCRDIFPTLSDLNVHLSEMSCGKRVLNCEECEYVAEDNRDLVLHVRETHRSYRCLECNFAYTDRLSLTHHATSMQHRVTNDDIDLLKCELCDFTAVSSRSLKSHMKRHINDQRYVQQPLEQYKCNLCGYVCHHLPSLKSHMWRHASDRNYSYEFTNDVINAAIDYDCRVDCTKVDDRDVMDKILSSERKILEDRLSKFVGDGLPEPVCWVTFRCCQCGFETCNKADLNLHMKSHLDVIQHTLSVSGGSKRRGSKRLSSDDQGQSESEAAKVAKT